jgi:oxaloacetate decarboxylase gamma subunit
VEPVDDMNEMLQQGVQLMLWGMGVVFALLALLVFVVKGMSGVAMAVDRSGPVPVPVPSPVPAEVTAGDGELVAAVTAALHRHRTGSKNQA